MPPSQPRLAGITAAIRPLLRGRGRRDVSHLGTACCGNPLSSSMVLQDAEQKAAQPPAFSAPAPAGQECREAGAVQRQPPSLLSCLARAERGPPSRSRLPSQRRGCSPKAAPCSRHGHTLHCPVPGSAAQALGVGWKGCGQQEDAPQKTRPMLRKLGGFERLTPRLKPATG